MKPTQFNTSLNCTCSLNSGNEIKLWSGSNWYLEMMQFYRVFCRSWKSVSSDRNYTKIVVFVVNWNLVVFLMPNRCVFWGFWMTRQVVTIWITSIDILNTRTHFSNMTSSLQYLYSTAHDSSLCMHIWLKRTLTLCCLFCKYSI